jgi:hypothetical protein
MELWFVLRCPSENHAGEHDPRYLISYCMHRCLAQRLESSPIGKTLLGKSQRELVACAGTPLQQTKTIEGTVLSYYKEAPMFEESSPFLKGSRAGAHHGCWAHLLMGEDRVVGVEYRSVPPSVHATDHCEEIFHTCAP